MTPHKSMPQKDNHDFEVNYPYVRVGTLACVRIKDIFTVYVCVCVLRSAYCMCVCLCVYINLLI